ncbi:uncharacterized protein LAESUDRAFT_658423 [Laetiporus sulphureus 93-53]|uniref:Uncharacterized protein n=1 Tax=Laetiporus sulphureus 93-53 TaxID=1314785 RepID=A0A165D3D9_9APHY|nr:uncharacterized protein LAESUDRAFT_658423 [Laetiporus sulphureus 93-53]KZT04080.1 hypothetical protein LAESUDRAFT_658423 [Laetiporus sulphureus 93-53]
MSAVTKEGMNEDFEVMLKQFYHEHAPDPELLPYYTMDVWIHLHLSAGGMIVLPASIHHRFSIDKDNKSQVSHRDEPKWRAYNCSRDTRCNSYRQDHLKGIQNVTVSA